MRHVILPDLGEGIANATIACWQAKVGDLVSEDDDIIELVTDKASFNVPAGTSGILKKICIEEGQEAKIGEILAEIEPAA